MIYWLQTSQEKSFKSLEIYVICVCTHHQIGCYMEYSHTIVTPQHGCWFAWKFGHQGSRCTRWFKPKSALIMPITGMGSSHFYSKRHTAWGMKMPPYPQPTSLSPFPRGAFLPIIFLYQIQLRNKIALKRLQRGMLQVKKRFSILLSYDRLGFGSSQLYRVLGSLGLNKQIWCSHVQF